MGQSRSALPDGIAAVDRAVMRRVAHSESRLARSRLVAAVLTGTVPRCCVYGEWLARKGTIASADGVPIWLSVDGEVATVEPGFTQAKRPHGLLVYQPAGNPAGGMPPTAPPWLRKRCSDALHVVRTSVPARLARRGTAPDPTASAGGPDLPPATAISR